MDRDSPTMESPEARKARRESLIAQREAVPPESRDRLQSALRERLRALPLLEGREIIGIYWPIRGEFDLRPLADEWRRQGKILALPVMNPKNPEKCGDRQPPGGLTFCRFDDGEVMVTGPFGVTIPEKQRPVQPDLLIAPCIGFAWHGGKLYRLGYGGGYYDRTLAWRDIPTVGVAWDEGELADFVPLPTDKPLAAAVTPSRVIPGVS